MMSNDQFRDYHRKSLILALHRFTFGRLAMVYREECLDAEIEFSRAVCAYETKSWWYRFRNRPPVLNSIHITTKYEAKLTRLQKLIDWLEKENTNRVLLSYEEVEEYMLDDCKELKGVPHVD